MASVAGDAVVCGEINSINSTMAVDGRATSLFTVVETTEYSVVIEAPFSGNTIGSS